jgi:cytochrome c-type protein NapC
VSETGVGTALTIVFAVLAALILVYYLARHPVLGVSTKLVLLAGLGVFPIAAAVSGNAVGFQRSEQVQFCNSCHVMSPYVKDALDPASKSIAAIHSRGPHFGGESCYTCHADYGMFGTVDTKLDGTKHMYEYFTKFRTVNPETAKIALYQPFPNSTCNQCHSMTAPGWLDEPEHKSVLEDIRSGSTSCTSVGCHGPAHPIKGKKAEAAS